MIAQLYMGTKRGKVVSSFSHVVNGGGRPQGRNEYGLKEAMRLDRTSLRIRHHKVPHVLGLSQEKSAGAGPKITGVKEVTHTSDLDGYLANQASSCPTLFETPVFRDAFSNRVLDVFSRFGREVEDPAPQEPGGYDILPEDDGGCTFRCKLASLARRAKTLVASEFGIPASSLKPLPKEISCGQLRTAVRSVFQDDLPEVVELSIKTTQKLEHRVCRSCEPMFEGFVEDWKTSRFLPQPVNAGHLSLFVRAFRANVSRGWNKRAFPYVPNGHATANATRRQGGNWNQEGFQSWCRPECVISSGKPRVVTLYSEYNTRILTPLHLSLYEDITRKGWVLVGNPEDNHIRSLNGQGEFISLDYKSATDNFKTDYVRAAIEVLIDQSEDLSSEEIDCLRVLGNLKFEEHGPIATRGQPMGSVLSFPLLCLFNKTVQDLALSDLLIQGLITFKEWTCHRTLINGDDSLTREPNNRPILLPRIIHHGTMVGMVVNEEKSMVSGTKAEINSTLFTDCRLQKKVNVASVDMRPEVNDVLGFAAQSTITLRGFLRVVLRNRKILAKQDDKCLYSLQTWQRRALWKDSRIRRCLLSAPKSKRPIKEGKLKMVAVPDSYYLSRAEEVDVINEEVRAIRERTFDFSVVKESKFRTTAIPSLTRPPCHKPTPRDPLILECLVRRFRLLENGKAVEEDRSANPLPEWENSEFDSVQDDLFCSGQRPSPINTLVGLIRRKEKKLCELPLPRTLVLHEQPFIRINSLPE
nr:MAG: RNA-dependent RNA polymerase [Sjack associated botourmia-like virus 15]